MDISTALETCRGVHATFTRTCKLQATTDRTLGSDGTPAPFGSVGPLRSRAGVLIQFLRAHDQFGAIYVRGDPGSPPPPFTAPKDSYPLRNDAGAKPEQRRRNRMLFLHVTARVPLYLQSAPTPRGGGVLEL